MESIWIELVLIVVSVLANGFFAGSEIALVSARTSRLVQMRSQNVAGAAQAVRLKEAPESFLATIQIAITLVGTLASAVGGAAAVEALTPWLAGLGLPGLDRWAGPVALALVILVIAYVSLVLGELVPKAIALRNPERLAALVATPIAAIGRLTSWLVAMLTASTNAILRLLGLGANAGSPFVSEDEVRYLVQEGASKGIFETIEAELVHNAFEFADRTVREIMVPRSEMRGLHVDTPPGAILEAAAAVGHSHIPVHRGSVEDPIGVVALLDLVAGLARAAPLAALVRPPIFIPEFARVSRLLREFQRRRQYLAFVVDEYGIVQGLVTLEDVVEEIVGSIREEGEPGDLAFVRRLGEGEWAIDGMAPARDLREHLGLPIEERADYTTLAGFVLYRLGSVPQPGTSFTAGGYTWTVVDMRGPRIGTVRVSRSPS